MVQFFDAGIEFINKIQSDMLNIGLTYPGFDFQAGQYVQIIFDKENTEDPNVGYRSYSIMNSPSDARRRGMIEICVKVTENGYASEKIKRFRQGEIILMRGPYGKFSYVGAQHNVMIAASTGIVPFISMISEHVDQGAEMILIFGTKNKDSLIMDKQLKELELEYKNFRYYPILSDQKYNWEGLTGYVQDHLTTIIKDFSNKTFYISGSEDFVKDIRRILLGKRVPDDFIMWERLG